MDPATSTQDILNPPEAADVVPMIGLLEALCELLGQPAHHKLQRILLIITLSIDEAYSSFLPLFQKFVTDYAIESKNFHENRPAL